MTHSRHTLHRPEAGIIGLIADTHVPDRADRMNPAIDTIFRHADLIIHAGDISAPQVLDRLNSITETVAVCGNNKGDRRNFTPPLPEQLCIRVRNEFSIGVRHGMEAWWQRIPDALLGRSGFRHYITKRITARVRRKLPEPEIIIFGHAHWPVVDFDSAQLAVNPGKAFSQRESSCAVLTIRDKTVSVKFHALTDPESLTPLVRTVHEFHFSHG